MGGVAAYVLPVILIGMVVLIFFKNKTKVAKDNENPFSVQELLDFHEIRSGMIHRKDNTYVKIIEVGTINYFMLSETEQENVEAAFRGMISTLTFPTQYFVQTKLLDISVLIENMERDVKAIPLENETLRNFGFERINYLKRLTSIRKPMIRTPYLVYTVKEGNYEKAVSEIKYRQGIIIDRLARIGLSGRGLNDQELAELLYTNYNKDRALNVPIKNLTDKSFYIKKEGESYSEENY